MDKPLSLTGLKALEKHLEEEAYQFRKKHYDDKVNAFKAQLWEENKIYIQSYQQKIEAVRAEIKLKKKELEDKKDPKIKEMQTYIDGTFSSGIDFGYNGLNVRYIDPKNRYVIVTNNGSVGGQGTAMGTGAYYYSNSSHFVVFPQYGNYMDAYFPHNEKAEETYFRRCTNASFEVKEGRLTNEIKNELIRQANEYCETWNVPPFKIEGRKAIILTEEQK